MTPTIIQKSCECPMIGVASVFMPNIDEKSVSGKVMNAMIVSVLMVSFCFVLSIESFAERIAMRVSKSAFDLWKSIK